jgi:hypothetical protein
VSRLQVTAHKSRGATHVVFLLLRKFQSYYRAAFLKRLNSAKVPQALWIVGLSRFGMCPASFCDRNSSAAVQFGFSCHTALDPGFHRRTSCSHPNCWRPPIPKKVRLFWRDSISSRYKMPARCLTVFRSSDYNWPTNSSSFRS